MPYRPWLRIEDDRDPQRLRDHIRTCSRHTVDVTRDESPYDVPRSTSRVVPRHARRALRGPIQAHIGRIAPPETRKVHWLCPWSNSTGSLQHIDDGGHLSMTSPKFVRPDLGALLGRVDDVPFVLAPMLHKEPMFLVPARSDGSRRDLENRRCGENQSKMGCRPNPTFGATMFGPKPGWSNFGPAMDNLKFDILPNALSCLKCPRRQARNGKTN